MVYSSSMVEMGYFYLFQDQSGFYTADLSGRNRLYMLRNIDEYANSIASYHPYAEVGTIVKSMFEGKGFTGFDSYLNDLRISIRSVTALSAVYPEVDRKEIESFMSKLNVDYYKIVSAQAEEGKPGRLGDYLVDEQGIVWGEVVVNSLIGGYQLDYIGNIQLDQKLTSDNYSLVNGKNYTELEHAWDEAYVNFTVTDGYAYTATDSSYGEEMYLGALAYNKAAYPFLYEAFLKGRVAIVNNEAAIYKEQARIIRNELEKAIASAAITNLKKTRDTTHDPAEKAHAYSKAIGLIFALRYAKLHGADDTFSEAILNNLAYTSAGMWRVRDEQLEQAILDIKTKFGLN
jgi:hypothetical protein